MLESSTLCFNPSESMDLVGSQRHLRLHDLREVVSILLSQWIWLEGLKEISFRRSCTSFNPSELMDLVGSFGRVKLRNPQ